METGADDGLRRATLDALARYRGRVGEACDLAGWVADAAEAPKRRSELIEWAEREHGMAPDRAAVIHDIAREEGLDPAFAFELVHCGVGVQDLGEPSGEETLLDGPPEWIASPAPSGASPARERRLRASFRRLRAHLAEARTPESALEAFVGESDVGEVVY